MKIRSRPLFNYLLLSDALNGTPEQIARAKQEYRRQYKRNWKLQSDNKQEIRFMVTFKQLAIIKDKALLLQLKHTTYARQCVLADSLQIAFYNDTLLKVLQLVSMSVIATEQRKSLDQIAAFLQEAETTLLAYLNIRP